MGISLNAKGEAKKNFEDERRGKKDGGKPTWGNCTAEEAFH
jgi:hypothetical protein